MRFYFWTNNGDGVGDYDILCIADEKEKQEIVEYFKDENAKSVCNDGHFYYLLNTNRKTITPLPKLSYALGGQYNDCLPIGCEYKRFYFNINEYRLSLYNEKVTEATKKIKLNDLLKLTKEEIKRTKVRFNQSNGEENPLEIFRNNPEELLKWNYWNSQSYKVGQISIGLVKMNCDEWLLFTVGMIMKVNRRKISSCVACEYKTANERYGQLFGRVIIKYHKRFQTQFPNAETVLDDLEVKEILPNVYTGFDFPGYDNVSLTYNELKAIINGNYPSYRNALENQQAVYVLTDTNTGKLYVGSATSKGKMLLERWRGYIDSFHNGNKGLIELFNTKGEGYFKKYFKYSIIENFNSKINPEFVKEREIYWKKVLDTRNHGYNKN